eukprot:TRINITY_DN13902_c0_g1_i1.p1 TRINITY_DN13902_c0_g1~~TRINITY_DN13902_c0_g1_i1.p1  ORF type:complete len:458 (-),score=98.42 TRINITY_DN13902_c0_g1_i1:208-1581(-)
MPPPSLLAHLDASKDASALSLAYASIGDEGCAAIARYMRENVMLRTMDLRGNNIRADGLVVLAHALRTSCNMTSLCLKWNNAGSHERGVQAICDVLKGNTSMTHLDLRNNKVGAEAGVHLAQMLRENSHLTHLDLSWNDLGVDGGKALLEGVQANHTLIDCQLSGNRIAEDTLHAIAFIIRRNRQTAPMGASALKADQPQEMISPPISPSGRSGMNATGTSAGAYGGLGQSAGELNMTSGTQKSDRTDLALTTGAQEAQAKAMEMPMPARTQIKAAPPVQDDELSLKLLQREQNHSNAEDARFFGEVAEYIDLLQLDVARNKKYRMDAEERERVVTKGFMEREMRYAQEMRELENLLAKAKAERDELLHDTQYVGSEIERVREEKAKTTQDRDKMEEIARATADRLRADIRDALTIKADLETQIYKIKRRQTEQEEENERLRTYLSKCKDDLDRALK